MPRVRREGGVPVLQDKGERGGSPEAPLAAPEKKTKCPAPPGAQTRHHNVGVNDHSRARHGITYDTTRKASAPNPECLSAASALRSNASGCRALHAGLVAEVVPALAGGFGGGRPKAPLRVGP